MLGFSHWSDCSHKALLLLMSMGVIALLGGSWVTPVFVVALLTVNYYTLAGHFAPPLATRVLLWLNWSVLPLGFFALQSYGYVGVLGDSSPAGSSANAVWLLGLPFYTLSILSLNHEIQTGHMSRPHWLDYVLFGVYFPKFLSGPVEQPAFMAQLSAFRFQYSRASLGAGCDWILLGAFCKFVVAYYLSRNVHAQEDQHVLTMVQSVIAFELQVYFDLAGYSFMAYGISTVLGLELTLNFNHPFFAGNIQSFWQRWHISLGRWFHQYVHTPLRAMGPRMGVVQWLLPILVFLLSAVWLGQTLNFLIWGLWHGLAYLVYVRWLRRRPWPAWLGLLTLVLVVLFGRFLFMESDFHFLIVKLQRLLSWHAWQAAFSGIPGAGLDIRQAATADLLVALVLSTGFLCAEWRSQRLGLGAYALFRRPNAQWLMIAIALLLIEGAPAVFIYARQ